MKIAIIGAGGFEFPLQLATDFLSFESLIDVHLVLMDIDSATLARTERLVRRVVEGHRLPAIVEATTDRRVALTKADVVVTCFQVGGLDAYAMDVEIPRRYGLDQTVGDTLGPGGVFRGLRSLNVLEGLVHDMGDLCPGALLLQYANPMAINCWYAAGEGANTVGLCHSVQHTAELLRSLLDVTSAEWSFRAAGINHQSWFLEARSGGRDVLDELRKAVREYGRGERDPVGDWDELDELYAGNREGVRREIMELTGYFQTESSHHASEYLPYFRRTPEEVAAFLPERWDYLEVCRAHDEAELEEMATTLATGTLETSEEYAAVIVDSLLTGTPRVVYANVPNTGLITNLPDGCCVEVPCLVDQSGVAPTYVGALPAPCAGVNLGSIAVQSCAVEAFRSRDRDLVHAAVALDKLTSAVMPLDAIRVMTDELLDAQAEWLPSWR
jgi:alpha-galactosidase